jgi:ATPase subunit of ABC transporter with duplicated ATPase domains
MLLTVERRIAVALTSPHPNVNMQFDGRPVLREAHLRLRRGDRVGLIGKNGTGKTTFLELVLGRRQPSGGTVDVTLGTTIGYFSQSSGKSTLLDVLTGETEADAGTVRFLGPPPRRGLRC